LFRIHRGRWHTVTVEESDKDDESQELSNGLTDKLGRGEVVPILVLLSIPQILKTSETGRRFCEKRATRAVEETGLLRFYVMEWDVALRWVDVPFDVRSARLTVCCFCIVIAQEQWRGDCVLMLINALHASRCAIS
jgi:hypothetical protein